MAMSLQLALKLAPSPAGPRPVIRRKSFEVLIATDGANTLALKWDEKMGVHYVLRHKGEHVSAQRDYDYALALFDDSNKL